MMPASAVNRRSHVQRCWLIVVIALAATACGSSTPSLGASDSRFCQVLASFPAESDNVEASQASEALAQLQAALPNNAPPEVRQPLEALAALAAFSATADGGSTLSDEGNERLSAAMEVLTDSNTDFFNGWLTGTCPDVVAAAGGTMLMGTTSGFSSGSTDSSQPTRVEAADAPEPVATVSAPTPTPTPIPAETTVVAENGHVGRYRDRPITVQRVTLTNATYDAFFFGNTEDATEQQLVIVEMFTQSNEFGGTMARSDFRLEDTNGRSIVADKLFDGNGTNRSQVNLEERDSADFVVSFVLPEPVESLTGWTMYYGPTDLINEPFPLIGTVASLYPISFDPPAEPVELVGRLGVSGFCDDIFSINVLDATVDIEGRANDLARSAPDRRFLTVEVELANEVEPQPQECRVPGPNAIWGYDWRLLADGIPQGYDASSYPSAQMATGERVQAFFRFEFPADASRLELVDEDSNVIVGWDVSLPPAPGEDGYAN